MGSLFRFIGGGAFGEVYLAKWHSTEVAVKCLAPSLLACNSSTGGASTNNSMSSTASSKAATELMQEAAILARMRHPNIVSVFGVVLPPRDMVGALSFEVDLPQEGSCDGNDLQKQGWMPDRVGHVSGPAVVCEYLSAGSLQNAIRSGAEWLKGKMAKVKVMLDTAKVSSLCLTASEGQRPSRRLSQLVRNDRLRTKGQSDAGAAKAKFMQYQYKQSSPACCLACTEWRLHPTRARQQAETLCLHSYGWFNGHVLYCLHHYLS